MSPTQQLLADIETFLPNSGLSETAFGMGALGDPNMLKELRLGREMRWKTIQKVRNFMASISAEQGSAA